MSSKRHDERSYDQLRHIKSTYNVFEYASGSLLLEVGKTKVLCAVTLQNSVPPFLRGKNEGWLTAEYSLLPASTLTRTPRESSLMRKNGRSVEISRFIGRALRTAIDFKALGERTITIDCDVLQADGGTRTACITGAYQALKKAQQRWLKSKIIMQPILQEEIAALSVGILNNEVILDPDYEEDCHMMADYNFVLTKSGKVIEILGGAEKEAVSWQLFEQASVCAREGVSKLFAFFDEQNKQNKGRVSAKDGVQKPPFFSLKNRS
jgi:ribonuclease PH